MPKNLAGDGTFGKDGEDAHRATTRPARETIDSDDALHQPGPIEPTTGLAVWLSDRCRCRNDGGAEIVVGPEYTVVTREVRSRWRDQRRELSQKLDRRERELGSTIAQGMLSSSSMTPGIRPWTCGGRLANIDSSSTSADDGPRMLNLNDLYLFSGGTPRGCGHGLSGQRRKDRRLHRSGQPEWPTVNLATFEPDLIVEVTSVWDRYCPGCYSPKIRTDAGPPELTALHRQEPHAFPRPLAPRMGGRNADTPPPRRLPLGACSPEPSSSVSGATLPRETRGGSLTPFAAIDR
jgi:hypothetical protein